MDTQKICFIINENDDAIYSEMLLYIKHLDIPQDFEMEVKRAEGNNIANSYNQAMLSSTAKYKIYLKSSVYLVEKTCILNILDIFKDSTIGIISTLGYDILPLREDLWCTQKEFGLNLISKSDVGVELDYGSDFVNEEPISVQRIEGFFIATQYDFLWRADIFQENVFYDNAQALEFIRKGYKAVIPNQKEPWCLCDDNVMIDEEKKKKSQSVFLKEYENEIMQNSIIRNYHYVEELKKLLFQESDLKEKLHLLNYLAVFASCNVWGKYSDPEIEQEIYKISNMFDFKKVALTEENNTVLHVMTEAYETGGHTRVVESWVKTDKKHKHSLIFTNPESCVPIWLKECIEASGGEILFVEGNSFFEKSENLFEQSMRFSVVLLCIHNYDLIPLLTYANDAWKKPIRFINHSDHLFWLGVGIIDLNLNITELAEKISVERRCIENNLLLYGPPQQKLDVITDENIKLDIKKQLHIHTDQKIITSMASDWRYTNSFEADFPQFVLDILSRCPDVIYIIIGADPYLNKWEILNGHPRVIFTGSIDKLKVSGIFSITDLYIDSFAHSSGGGLVDAFIYGLPVLSLNCDRVDFLKPFSKKTVDNLLNTAIGFLNGEKVIDTALQEKCYNKYHNEEAWKQKMEEVYKYKIRHSFHILDETAFKVEEMDIKVGKQFNPRMTGILLDLYYPESGKYCSAIKEKIEGIYRIHLEQDRRGKLEGGECID